MSVQTLQCPGCGAPLDPEARACAQCGATAATRRCAACLDLSFARDRNCRRCGALLPVEEEVSSEPTPPCAGCGAHVTRRRAGTALFDECDHCGGLWLSPATLEEVTTQAETRSWLRSVDAAPDETAAQSVGQVAYRRCPRCSKVMNRTRYALGSGVVLDVCKDHGTYFDRGEMARICAFIEGGGLTRARRREAETLKEDIRDARRKAMTIGRGESTHEPSGSGLSGGSGIDLLRVMVELFTRQY